MAQHSSGPRFINTSRVNSQIGHIHGNPTFNILSNRNESPLIPSHNIPFPRDEDFVDRGVLLDEIKQTLSKASARAAIHGLGGVGKSQLAIEYAYRLRDEDPNTWIFWIHGSSRERFDQGVREVAHLLRLPGRDDPGVDLLEKVSFWLRTNRKENWLIVLDNVDDATYLLTSPEPGVKPLWRCFPDGMEGGAILMTTRRADMAMKLMEPRQIIAVQQMSLTEAISLLRTKLAVYVAVNLEDADESLIKLARLLEQIPLALVQATAYIGERAPRYDIEQYIQDLYRSHQSMTYLLSHNGGELRRDWQAANSIIATWHISFDYICHIRSSAADLLSLMSLCDPKGIPECLIRTHTEENVRAVTNDYARAELVTSRPKRRLESATPLEEMLVGAGLESSSYESFEADIVVLRNFAFVKFTNDNQVFEIHTLVQLAMRNWLDRCSWLEMYQSRYIEKLYNAFPEDGEFQHWAQCRLLLPHVKSAVAQKVRNADVVEKYASLMHRAAWYLIEMGSYEDAEDLSRLSVDLKQRCLGNDHASTLGSMNLLGSALQSRGKWIQASMVYTETLVESLRSPGKHSDTILKTLGNFAMTLFSQGKLVTAHETMLQVMETSEHVRGASHPDTLKWMSNLAATLHQIPLLNQIIDSDVAVVEISTRVLGAEHPHTLMYRAKQAMNLYDQGRWAEAEALQVELLSACRRVQGERHPNTLLVMSDLAETWRALRNEAKAVELMQECEKLQHRILGADHPDTVRSTMILKQWNQARTMKIIYLCIWAGLLQGFKWVSLAIAVYFGWQG